mmetsp:Transcript_26592/g.55215  ORF Transcript_26592/g.55215 Transcript_26592/m.55215 type:complete len:209 (-) Transcript_26592:239-865(-)
MKQTPHALGVGHIRPNPHHQGKARAHLLFSLTHEVQSCGDLDVLQRQGTHTLTYIVSPGAVLQHLSLGSLLVILIPLQQGEVASIAIAFEHSPHVVVVEVATLILRTPPTEAVPGVLQDSKDVVPDVGIYQLLEEVLVDVLYDVWPRPIPDLTSDQNRYAGPALPSCEGFLPLFVKPANRWCQMLPPLVHIERQTRIAQKLRPHLGSG